MSCGRKRYGRLVLWTQEDWSTSPVDAGGLVDFSYGRRRTGRVLLWMQEDWSTLPAEGGGMVDFLL